MMRVRFAAVTATAALGVTMLGAGCGDGDGGGAVDATTTTDATSATDATTTEDTTTTATDAADTTPAGTPCTSDGECSALADTPVCDTDAGVCVPLPRGHQIGKGDGSAASITLTPIVQPNQAYEATDLDFHGERDELWIINRVFEVPGLCSQSNGFSDRCQSLAGFVVIVFEPGTENQRAELFEDGNGWHFMRRPPAMAMGDNEAWASCGEAATGNFEDNAVNYMGPTLWSSDLDIFAQPSGGNGSHLDMLHETPFCMGIAHETGNAYWLFNGHIGAIDRYDFNEPHEPGGEDHNDGEIFRYVKGQVKRLEGVPSHMEFNAADNHLYIADSGNARIVKLDTKSGAPAGNVSPIYETLAAQGEVDGATLTEVVPAGTLQEPSGLLLHDGLIFVTDHATSKIHAFEMDGTEVRSVDTGLPAGSLAGITAGPDGRIWLTDMLTGSVYRLDPQ